MRSSFSFCVLQYTVFWVFFFLHIYLCAEFKNANTEPDLLSAASLTSARNKKRRNKKHKGGCRWGVGR